MADGENTKGFMKGDVVQVTDPEHHWYPAVLVVDTVVSIGVTAYTHILNNDPATPNPLAYIRLENKSITKVGQIALMPKY